MEINSEKVVFIDNLSGIKSPTFTDKFADDVLAIYEVENSFELYKDSSKDEIVKNLSINMNSNPDGWLVFINEKHQEEVKKIIKEEFIQAFNDEKLNFSNGELAETILYYYVNNGLVIELVDPECTSDFFTELITKIQTFLKEKKADSLDFLSFDLYHMSSNISTLNEVENGVVFLNILKENNIKYNE